MPTHVMPDKVKQATQSLDRLIRQHVAPEGQPVDVGSYILLASVLADQLGADGDRLLTVLRDGTDAQAARAMAADLLATAETWSEVARLLRDMAARETGEPIKELADLTADAVRVEAIRAVARDVVDAMDAAHQLPLDSDMLRQSEGDFAAGRFQKGKEVIARLRSRKSPTLAVGADHRTSPA